MANRLVKVSKTPVQGEIMVKVYKKANSGQLIFCLAVHELFPALH